MTVSLPAQLADLRPGVTLNAKRFDPSILVSAERFYERFTSPKGGAPTLLGRSRPDTDKLIIDCGGMPIQPKSNAPDGLPAFVQICDCIALVTR